MARLFNSDIIVLEFGEPILDGNVGINMYWTVNDEDDIYIMMQI